MASSSIPPLPTQLSIPPGSPSIVNSPNTIRSVRDLSYADSLARDLDSLNGLVNKLYTLIGTSSIAVNRLLTFTTALNNTISAGVTEDIVVRDAAGTGTVTLHFVSGIYTGHT